MQAERIRKRPNAWVCVLINQLAFPGMGTVMAGKRVGYLQAVMMVAGFCLVLGFMLWFFVCVARYLAGAPWTEEEFGAQYRPYAWLWQSGLALCLFSWFWALLSSVSLLRHAKSESDHAPMSAPHPPGPPPLPPSDAPS
jgi:hypothetical protein